MTTSSTTGDILSMVPPKKKDILSMVYALSASALFNLHTTKYVQASHRVSKFVVLLDNI